MTIFHRVTEGKLGSHDGCAIEDEVSQEFLDRIPGGLFRYRADDEGGTIDYVSRDVLELFGCATYEEFCAITDNSFIGMVHPDDRRRVTDEITSQIKCGNTYAVTYRLNRPDGAEVWVDDRGRYVVDDEGQAWFYVTIIDITEKMSYQRKLERAEERVEMLTVLSRDVIFDIDCQAQTGEIFGDFEARFNREPQSDDLILQKRCDKECSIDLEVHDIERIRDIVAQGDFIDTGNLATQCGRRPHLVPLPVFRAIQRRWLSRSPCGSSSGHPRDGHARGHPAEEGRAGWPYGHLQSRGRHDAHRKGADE